MERVEETLGVGFEADVATVQTLLKFFIFQIKGVLAVGQRGVALQVERVGNRCRSCSFIG